MARTGRVFPSHPYAPRRQSAQTFQKTLTVASTSVPKVVRQGRKPLSVIATTVPLIKRQPQKLLKVSSTDVPKIAKQAQRPFARLSVTTSPTVTKRPAKALKVTSTASAQAVKRRAGKALAVAAAAVPTWRKTLSRTLVASAKSVLHIVKQAQRVLVINIPAGPGFRGVKALPTVQWKLSRALTVTSSVAAARSVQAQKSLHAAVAGVPALARRAGKTLRASSTGTAAITIKRVFLRTFSVAVNTLTSITRGAPPWHLRVGFSTTKHMKSVVSARVHVAQPPDLFTKRVLRRFNLMKANVYTIEGGGPYIQKRAVRQLAPLPVAVSSSMARQLGKVLLRPVTVVVSLARQYIPTAVGQKGSVGISDRGSGGLSVSDRAFQSLAGNDTAAGGLSVLDRGAGSATAADEAGELVSVSDR